MKNFKKDWMTSLVGVLIFVSVILLLLKRIEVDQFLAATGFLTGAGLVFARDREKELNNESTTTTTTK
jgi:hypothetical protein